jgi:hypothetical protein
VPFGVRLPPLPFYRSGVPDYAELKMVIYQTLNCFCFLSVNTGNYTMNFIQIFSVCAKSIPSVINSPLQSDLSGVSDSLPSQQQPNM